ncbi:MAG: alpha-galactosidase [Herbinix sp.]|nr:alpha-galactosidase [Herbinix sp.]
MKKKYIAILGGVIVAAIILALVLINRGGENENGSDSDDVSDTGQGEVTPGSDQTDNTDNGQGEEMEDKTILVQNSITVEQKSNELLISNGLVKVVYKVWTGEADIYRNNEEMPTILGAFAETILEDGTVVKSTDLNRSAADYVKTESLDDGFGKGVKVTVESKKDKLSLLQNYYFYEELPYILLEAVVASEETVKTNNIAPIMAGKGDFKTPALEIAGDDPRFIFTPYDNDAFVRYSALPLMAASESYEVTAIYDNTTRKGFIVGSVSHDTWKTGIKVKQGGIDDIVELRVYGGITSPYTRDKLPHGYVSGQSVSSPKIFLGFYDDYRDGMEAYGSANAVIAPALAWDKGIPMGWNSWSAVADKVSYDIYVNSSDFVKENLQNNSFSNEDVVYINFDSFWDNLSEYQLKQAAQHVIDNGQIPGIYYTPFTFWGGSYTAGAVEGTNNRYSWQDAVLKDPDGAMLPAVDGGVSIDPTHPASVMRIEYMFNKFREWGFQYVKLDFMSHGAREGVFYNKDITTGTQAYNYGMQKMLEVVKEEIDSQEFFISLSIAPMFPSQYAHSRRISCDVFGTIDNAEYMLNSLTYGWWMNGTIYPFNDPDHIVTYNSYNHRDAILFNEGLTRYISSAIAGTMMIDSDDFRIPAARERSIEILTNEEINAVAKAGVSFRPVEGNTKEKACDTFMRYDEVANVTYLAVFNFSADEKKNMSVELSRIDLDPNKQYAMYDLWSKETVDITGAAEISLDKAEPKLFRISEK